MWNCDDRQTDSGAVLYDSCRKSYRSDVLFSCYHATLHYSHYSHWNTATCDHNTSTCNLLTIHAQWSKLKLTNVLCTFTAFSLFTMLGLYAIWYRCVVLKSLICKISTLLICQISKSAQLPGVLSPKPHQGYAPGPCWTPRPHPSTSNFWIGPSAWHNARPSLCLSDTCWYAIEIG